MVFRSEQHQLHAYAAASGDTVYVLLHPKIGSEAPSPEDHCISFRFHTMRSLSSNGTRDGFNQKSSKAQPMLLCPSQQKHCCMVKPVPANAETRAANTFARCLMMLHFGKSAHLQQSPIYPWKGGACYKTASIHPCEDSSAPFSSPIRRSSNVGKRSVQPQKSAQGEGRKSPPELFFCPSPPGPHLLLKSLKRNIPSQRRATGRKKAGEILRL